MRKDVQSNELKQRELMGFRFSNVDRSLLRKPKCANEYNEQVSLRTTASNF